MTQPSTSLIGHKAETSQDQYQIRLLTTNQRCRQRKLATTEKRNALSPAPDLRPQPNQPDPQELSTAEPGAGTQSPPPNDQPVSIHPGTSERTTAPST